MRGEQHKWRVVGSVTLATVVFSVFRQVTTALRLGNRFAALGWSMIAVIAGLTLTRMVSSGIGTLMVVPPVLGLKRKPRWLSEWLTVDAQGVLVGALSFGIFGILGATISAAMGIYRGDLATILARPDIAPDPDVVGWGWFIMAWVPAIWEELAFRGFIQSKLRRSFSTRTAILLGATFFGLFHLTNLLVQPPAVAIPGVVMAFFFGLAWGVMTVKARSIVPAIIAHYLVDSAGQVFINVEVTDPALSTAFFLLLTLSFPLVNIVLTTWLYREKAIAPASASNPSWQASRTQPTEEA